MGQCSRLTLWKVLLWGSVMLGRLLNFPLRWRMYLRGGPAWAWEYRGHVLYA